MVNGGETQDPQPKRSCLMSRLLKPRIIVPFVLVVVLSPLVVTYHETILGTIIGMSLLVVFVALFIVFAESVIYLIECVYKNKWIPASDAFGFTKSLKNDIKELF